MGTKKKSPSKKSLRVLLEDARACRVCEEYIDPRPVLQAGAKAKLVIIGQAPGRKVHENGVAWDDISGRRLRAWLAIDDDVFYDPDKVCLLPMGFCFPGSGKSGDLPPREECAPLWHPPLLKAMPKVKLTLLLGMYAQDRYLDHAGGVTERVQHWKSDLKKGRVALPHPSPRSRWTRVNPWFEKDVLPAIRKVVAKSLKE